LVYKFVFDDIEVVLLFLLCHLALQLVIVNLLLHRHRFPFGLRLRVLETALQVLSLGMLFFDLDLFEASGQFRIEDLIKFSFGEKDWLGGKPPTCGS